LATNDNIWYFKIKIFIWISLIFLPNIYVEIKLIYLK
jgi:hypothetical protein